MHSFVLAVQGPFTSFAQFLRFLSETKRASQQQKQEILSSCEIDRANWKNRPTILRMAQWKRQLLRWHFICIWEMRLQFRNSFDIFCFIAPGKSGMDSENWRLMSVEHTRNERTLERTRGVTEKWRSLVMLLGHWCCCCWCSPSIILYSCGYRWYFPPLLVLYVLQCLQGIIWKYLNLFSICHSFISSEHFRANN